MQSLLYLGSIRKLSTLSFVTSVTKTANVMSYMLLGPN